MEEFYEPALEVTHMASAYVSGQISSHVEESSSHGVEVA